MRDHIFVKEVIRCQEISKCQRHELSALFGDMTELEFSELKNDIDQNGFAQPVIYTYESKILDGWHRYQVAIELDKVSELKFTALDGIQNPLGFAMGVNYFRRHMNASHRAVVKALAHESEWLQLGDNQHLQGVQDCTPKSSRKWLQRCKYPNGQWTQPKRL